RWRPLNVGIAIDCLEGAGLAAAKPEIVRVYAAAFGAPPYHRDADDAHRFLQTLDQHAHRRDFRLLAAGLHVDGPHAGGLQAGNALLGFAYGYTGARGQWWHDIVSSVMPRDDVARWLEDSFELVELAVEPGAQGRGIGARLHDTLLTDLSNRTAVLSTIAQETVALGLYRRRGWQVLVPSMVFPSTPVPFQVLGLDLAARRLAVQP
ncbi:MAG: GNAT family N-acetyltransferase, partial [Dehalococcoidia bacterium]